MLAGPHTRSLSLGGVAASRFPPTFARSFREGCPP